MHFFRFCRTIAVGLSLFFSATAYSEPSHGPSIHAYYTRVDSGEPSEKSERIDDYADVIVKLDNPDGQLVFAHGTSYLPVWKTAKGKWPLEELVPRQGDGTAARPDRVNAYSYVAIIESSPTKVVVHWRYLSRFSSGNPHGNLDTDNFVDELFTITSKGEITRVMKQGTKTIDEWNDPLNQTTRILTLTSDGVLEVNRATPGCSTCSVPIKGNPIKGPVVGSPVAWFKFDDAQGDTTEEAISKNRIAAAGHKTLWKQGVSGTALQFDGYRSFVALPQSQAPKLKGGDLSLEAWVALGAYPWNWAPIVQQGDNDGYFLGINSTGYPGLMLKVGANWHELSAPSQPPYKDANHLSLFRWYYIAGTYSKTDGMMRLYLDGKEIAAKQVGAEGARLAQADTRIGKAGIQRKPTNGTHDTHPSDFGLDGLIDEVRVHDVALTAGQVAQSHRNFDPGNTVVAAPDMQRRALPNPDLGSRFGGIYTRLPYYETWDNLWRFGPYADVVVGFDQLPIKFVFWRGVSYIPMIVNESNQWFSNEFNETGFKPDAPGDCEPMSDKPCWSSHVRILENTPARVVVHWRYRLVNPVQHWAFYDQATGWGDLADWYYYIYPDGVATKRMRCYTGRPDLWHEWDEQMAILGEGQHPESVVKRAPVMTLVDKEGKATDYDWNPEPPRPDFKGKIVQLIHYTGRFSPFTIQDFKAGSIYRGERTWYSVFPSWNHWPTSQINSSGRNSLFPDRAAHCSISQLSWASVRQQSGDVPYLERTLMEGMTDQNAESLCALAKSWLQAPPIEPISDCGSASYDQAQRAYVLTATGSAPSFLIVADTERPIVNLCFVVKNWNCDDKAKLVADSKPVTESPDFRQGIVRDIDGRQMLVAWVKTTGITPVIFTLSRAKTDNPNATSTSACGEN